jgi:cation diffusion facilitator CzcD-associated flavoprotein CzcO
MASFRWFLPAERVNCSVPIFSSSGAGPAGLTTAYMLAEADRDVTVIERDPTYVGGISRTVNYKGFHFDIGGHRFFSKSKEVVRCGMKSSPMISSSGRASRAYSIAASSILIH